jgi:hypothetical protein
MSKSMLNAAMDVRPARWTNRKGALYVLCLVAICLIACNETLPPYAEPQTPFSGVIYVRYQSRIQTLTITLTVKSTFDETLQDTAKLAGALQIVLADAPQYSKTVSIDRKNFITYGSLDPQTGLLTVNSGDSLSFVYNWDFVTDNGAVLPTDVFVKQPDPQFPGRTISPPETFIVSGVVQVFTRFGQVTFFPIRFVMNYDYSA